MTKLLFTCCQDKLCVVHADISSSSADDQHEIEVQTLATIESRAAPTDVLRDFQQYQVLKRQHMESRHSGYPTDSRSVMVPDIAGQYAMRHGMQYYRDLAGNVKQVSNKYIQLDGTHRVQTHAVLWLSVKCARWHRRNSHSVKKALIDPVTLTLDLSNPTPHHL